MQEWVLYLLLLKHLRPVWDSEDIQELMVGFKAWVDEWDEIDALVRSSSSRLIIFMDGNQAVYQVATDLATRLNAKSVTLRVNLRNTRLIARVVDKLYEGPRAQVAGPEGLAPQLMKVKNEQEAIEGISSKILNLHQLEGVKLGDIVVLSASKLFLRKLEALFRTMRLIYGSSTSRSGLSVTIDLIQAFKGLESSFVFLYADADAGNSRELSYVGTSRARTNLYVYSLSENSMIARSFLE
jgi:superfamily I DNA/RNA helicase